MSVPIVWPVVVFNYLSSVNTNPITKFGMGGAVTAWRPTVAVLAAACLCLTLPGVTCATASDPAGSATHAEIDLFDSSELHRFAIQTSPREWTARQDEARTHCEQRARIPNSLDWRTSPFYKACVNVRKGDPCQAQYGHRVFSGICIDGYFPEVNLCTTFEAVVAPQACTRKAPNDACQIDFSDHGRVVDFLNTLTRTSLHETFFGANLTFVPNVRKPTVVESRLNSPCVWMVVPRCATFYSPIWVKFRLCWTLNMPAPPKFPWQAHSTTWSFSSNLLCQSRSSANGAFTCEVGTGMRVASEESVIEEVLGAPVRQAVNWPAPPGSTAATTFNGARVLFADADDCPAQQTLEAELQSLLSPTGSLQVPSVQAGLYEPLLTLESVQVHSFQPIFRNASSIDWRKDALDFLHALHSETRQTDPAAWRAGMEAVFQVDSFLRWLAVNTVFENYDAYGAFAHNYRLYRSPCSGKIHFLPFDFDWAMQPRIAPIPLDMSSLGDNWPLIRYLMDDPVYKLYYMQFLGLFLEEYFSPEYMSAQAARLTSLISSSVLREDIDISGLDEAVFRDALKAIRSYVVERSASSKSQLSRMIADAKLSKKQKKARAKARATQRQDL
ncbi:hypothetical protein CAOG_08138 [Capsaspora owczarzaki ATCC 30864]|uniref:hypothetical protein n=1 Tax=Capsaspora owczarzaki (strain ATCC 30864) TaxID=595528 RepID=UPI0001FE41BE|nr:hypothetical protein CAOG_08138 [Capsaspora owczarzaki ATCC 30864]|eukprot:XP_004342739.1 hypothetical protein CAOG_08138 [Capsaspora owczarzaki ATCC 30864]